MGTEVKLKREAIERRIAELEGKMPDIQASKEGAEARATIRRLKARLKTYPQEPKKRIYKVKARFIFDGVFEIRAHTRKEAVQMAKIGCGMNIGEIHTCWIDPKDFMPEANKNVLVKCSSGEIQTDFYAPELGGFFIEHSTHAKVTGWREMM